MASAMVIRAATGKRLRKLPRRSPVPYLRVANGHGTGSALRRPTRGSDASKREQGYGGVLKALTAELELRRFMAR